MDNKICKGVVGIATYVSLPTTVTELQSKKGSIVSGKCALEYCNTYPDLKKPFAMIKNILQKSQTESYMNLVYIWSKRR